MPPRTRKPVLDETAETLDDVTSAPPVPTEPEADPLPEEMPCTDCFPSGWPNQSEAVGCVHGQWAREAVA